MSAPLTDSKPRPNAALPFRRERRVWKQKAAPREPDSSLRQTDMIAVEELRETAELDLIPGEIIDLGPATAKAARPVEPGFETEERPAAPIPEGSIWDGRYRIERSLGEGGMGNVLLASDLADHERPIALKVLHPSFREVATPYFMREYSIQRELRHPSIARALDLGFDLQGGEEVPYFAMPFVPGLQLSSLIAEMPNPEQVWRWTLDLLEALDAIHRAGFLHRDIKPGNILVDPRAEDGPAARLIDFGIAVPLSAETEDFFIGTPEFSAPERIECKRPFDLRSDLYAVGLILYELIEGVAPWPGTDPETLLYERREVPARPMERECPEGVKQLIRELIDGDVERRPASAAVVIERLRAAVSANPFGLGAQSTIESPAAFAQRLSGLPVPSASYKRALETEAEVLVIHVPPGHDGSELLDELGDRKALSGVRVVRLKLEGRGLRPLDEMQGALDIFRRLRERSDMQGKEKGGNAFKGLAGAAVLLTRLHRKTLLVIDGLDQADDAMLMVLGQCFLGAQNVQLQVVASVSTDASPKAPVALDAFVTQEFVKQVTLEPLTLTETTRFVTQALGPGLLDPEVIENLHESSFGRPVDMQRLLVEAFKRGILLRRPDGYLWMEEERPRNDHELSGLLVVDLERDLADRISLLQSPLPAGPVERYLGDSVGFRRLVSSGVLAMTAGEWVVAVQRDACSWRYAALDPARRTALHRELAEQLARANGQSSLAGLVAEQLAQTERPAASAPWLVIAAHDARIEGEDKQAASLLQRAQGVIERDEVHDELQGEWRLMVLSGRLELAQAATDIDATIAAASDLLDAAVECAHLPSIERALAAELDLAEDSWDLPLIQSGVDRLLLFQQSCGGEPLEGLRAWQRAVAAAVEGDPSAVFRWVSAGLKGLDTAARLGRWLRKKLLTLQAEVSVRGGFRQVAAKALDALERLHHREQSDPGVSRRVSVAVDSPPAAMAALALNPLNPAADAIEARLVSLRALWSRKLGEFGQARALVEAYEERPQIRKRASVALELAECELEANHLEGAQRWAKEGLARARRERLPHLVHAAESLIAEIVARNGELERAVAQLEGIAQASLRCVPQVIMETQQRWLVARLTLLSREVSTEGRDLFESAEALAKTAARVQDVGATARAVFLLVQVALRTRRPVEALANADWLEQLAATEPVGAPPRHAVEWLVASVHYQLKWFKSANALSRRAMETMRIKAQSTPEGDREAWLSSDKSFIGFFR